MSKLQCKHGFKIERCKVTEEGDLFGRLGDDLQKTWYMNWLFNSAYKFARCRAKKLIVQVKNTVCVDS